MRYFMLFAYDGTDFHGWQIQPNAVSVQQRLNEALSTLLRQPISTVGAGRTDTGVHAQRMVAHFDLEAEQQPDLEHLTYKLNRLLAPSIYVYGICPVVPTAHARFDATARTYHYYVDCVGSPFVRRYAYKNHHFSDAKAFAKMNEAAQLLLTTSDFTSFSKLHTDVKTNICHVSHAEWVEDRPGLWRFTITADRFLRNMVRAIVGTLLQVGGGQITQERFAAIIAEQQRSSAGDSAPAHALFLVDVAYPDSIFPEGQVRPVWWPQSAISTPFINV